MSQRTEADARANPMPGDQVGGWTVLAYATHQGESQLYVAPRGTESETGGPRGRWMTLEDWWEAVGSRTHVHAIAQRKRRVA